MNNDLTEGKPSSVLWRFCIPLFGSIIFQQFYNLADSFVAGKFIGENALAAVGNSYEITLVFLAFAFGCNIGCSVIVSRLFGSKDYSDLKTAVYTTFISVAFLCIFIIAAGIFWGFDLLKLINTPENVIDDSKLYLDIYIYGLPFVFYYNISTGVFSALGDSKTPFIFLACSSLSNIFLDIIFVTVFNFGLAGIAWATFICQGVSCILALILVFLRLNKIKTEGKTKLFSKRLFKDISLIAIPSILQQSFVSVGNVIIQGVINGFGSAAMAGYSASIKLNNLVITSLTTVGNGISNFTAQNIGAQKFTRVKEGFYAGLKLVWTLCVPIVIIYLFAGKYIVYAFIDSPTDMAMEVALQILNILAPFYFVVSTKLVSDGILRGAGMMNKFMAATFIDLFLRVTLSIVLSEWLGIIGIWISWPVGWIIGTSISVLFYKSGKWNK